MNQPSLDKLMEKVDSKYTLVVLAAKRARALVEKQDPLVGAAKSAKPVSVALHEIVDGKVSYRQAKGGIK
ncbi:DNA-directed RNA polymerase subunit omega [Heliobacterium undosum]|uniref:DNA-directed RNA polymerase subunit omega n=1 Tax=Heliomicrobium undosum TaxID=121734 RepID=A0A845KZ99_9FIRM|nr:DNA-directed RNA polymerase subunit omega [Heliomicrobium undosum]MZP29043.1 DNA-directed RNA polymerase subunit omega [Heliomicrobium undosum]